MRKLLVLLLAIGLLTGCSQKKATNKNGSVVYEIFVGSFYDSNNDGIGDLNGITAKLDYLQDLGVSTLWLMPIHPSNTYHKYDVIDYYGIDPKYGTIEDFENLVSKAKEHNISIIIDLVLNHSADDHPWFQSARKAYINGTCNTEITCEYYNISQEKIPNSYPLGAGYYYEAVFWSEMPDLNLDSSSLRNEIKNICEFWLDKGVAGFRLDAVMHYYAENIIRNNEFINWFSDTVKSINPNATLVGEAWTGITTMLSYYESQIDSLFNFPLSQGDGKIITSIRNGKGASLAREIVDTQNKIKQINPNAYDSPFLSNHDQGRSAGFLSGQLEKQKLAASVYLLLPGTPYVYYGEEIGMLGSGIDENKRLAMLWSQTDLTGKCNNPVNSNYDVKQETAVDTQSKDNESLLNHYKSVIEVRNRFPWIKDARIELYESNNESIFSVTISDESNRILVVHNFSDTIQTLEVNGKIVATLNTNEKSTIKNKVLSIQPYGSVVIKLEGE